MGASVFIFTDPKQNFRRVSSVAGIVNINFDRPSDIHSALEWFGDGLDFGDALHLALAGDCDELLSFDKDFIKDSVGLTSCAVKPVPSVP
ncbi:hypothetical protein BH09SUM1_BH09SUM1_28640 [soil metagenome]